MMNQTWKRPLKGWRQALLCATILMVSAGAVTAQESGTSAVRKVKIVKNINGVETVIEKEIPEGVDAHSYLLSEGLIDKELPPMPEIPAEMKKGDRVIVEMKSENDGEVQFSRKISIIRNGKVVMEDEEVGDGLDFFLFRDGELPKMEWKEEGSANGKSHIIVREFHSDDHPAGNIEEHRATTVVFIRLDDLTTQDAELLKTMPDAQEAENSLTVENLEIFPNPSDGNFTLQFQTLENKKPVIVRVTDPAGKIVMETIHRDKNGVFREPIDLSAYPNGMYFLTITQGDRQFAKKVIVQ